MTFIHWCEVEQHQDANAATSEAEIEGKILTYHDIGVVDLVINQGYNVDDRCQQRYLQCLMSVKDL